MQKNNPSLHKGPPAVLYGNNLKNQEFDIDKNQNETIALEKELNRVKQNAEAQALAASKKEQELNAKIEQLKRQPPQVSTSRHNTNEELEKTQKELTLVRKNAEEQTRLATQEILTLKSQIEQLQRHPSQPTISQSNAEDLAQENAFLKREIERLRSIAPSNPRTSLVGEVHIKKAGLYLSAETALKKYLEMQRLPGNYYPIVFITPRSPREVTIVENLSKYIETVRSGGNNLPVGMIWLLSSGLGQGEINKFLGSIDNHLCPVLCLSCDTLQTNPVFKETREGDIENFRKKMLQSP